METVTIQKAFNTGRLSKTGTPFIDVTLNDGRRGTSTDEGITDMVGKTTQLDIKEKGEYKGVMQFWFNLPKKGPQTPEPHTQPTEGLARIESKIDRIIKHLNINELTF